MKNQDIMLFDVAKENTYIATYRPEFTHENRTIKFELRQINKETHWIIQCVSLW